MTAKIKLNHSGGNGVSLNAPANNPSISDVEFKLPVADGSNGQYLKTDGSGNLSFGSIVVPAGFPDCIWSVRMSQDQPIANQTETTISFDTVVIDTESGYNTTQKQFTVPTGKGGKYFMYMRAGIPNMDEGKQLNVNLRINGQYDVGNSPYNDRGMYNRHESGGGAEQIGEQVSWVGTLNAGQYVDARIWHNEGNSQNLGNWRGMFFGYRLSS
tara:strand:- start:20 stop:658 length:639 start_codon:yes stop_codon:yes gene_type:complete